ncbi:hypothetical protein C479_13763 [Halovivax asiaticus JCM 14624]|uniref:DUF3784 domain-containing protein n=1 Tax=Halovivax asiaticus JCM 14624 TaxID=1227490 RepID=M0BC52_9EURY|nr:hypothetical protein [Halovivax asiaticus]ELZ08410.1 hypothetical protein C479_13763 [Halovivax asiaticus JCM 14624]
MDSAAFGLAGAGLLVFILGALIKYAGMVELVAGYDPDTVTDDEALANVVGTNVIAVGVLGLGCAAVLVLEPTASSVGWLVFTLGTVFFAVRAIRGARRDDTKTSN